MADINEHLNKIVEDRDSEITKLKGVITDQQKLFEEKTSEYNIDLNNIRGRMKSQIQSSNEKIKV